METKLEKRIEKLKKYDDAYYNSDNAIITDSEYDSLREKTEKLFADFPENKKAKKYFSRVRASVRQSKRNTKLPIVLGSLKKAKNDSIKDMENYIKRVRKESLILADSIKDKKLKTHYSSAVNFVISPKLDGLTFLLHYENGKLKQALSGGDGINGQLKMEHAKILIERGLIPAKIEHKNNRYIIGEIVCSKKKFAKQKTYNEIRNAASGWLNSDTPAEELNSVIDYVAYDVKTDDGDLGCTKTIKEIELGAAKKANKINTISKLNAWGFRTYAKSKLFTVVTAESFNENFKKLLDSFLEQIDSELYPLDGLVVEVSDSIVRKQIGADNSGTPKFAVAYKKSADSAIKSGEGNLTVVTKIETSTSKSGALKPTLIYNQIKIGNANFTRATGNNFSYLVTKGIGIGTKINIVKAGDVIPKAYFADDKKASEKRILVEKCGCGARAIQVKNEKGKVLPDLYCEHGTKCPLAKYEQLVFAIKSLKITGLGVKNIKKLYDAGFTDILELSEIKNDKSKKKTVKNIEGFGDSILVTLTDGLHEKLEKATLAQIAVLSNVFTRKGLSLAEKSFVSIEKLFTKATKEKSIDENKCIAELGNEKGKLLYDNFNKWLKFYKKFSKAI